MYKALCGYCRREIPKADVFYNGDMIYCKNCILFPVRARMSDNDKLEAIKLLQKK